MARCHAAPWQSWCAMMCQAEHDHVPAVHILKSPASAHFIPHYSTHLWRWGCWERERRSRLSGLLAHSCVANHQTVDLADGKLWFNGAASGNSRILEGFCILLWFGSHPANLEFHNRFTGIIWSESTCNLCNKAGLIHPGRSRIPMLWFACMPQAKLIPSEE